MDVQVERWMPTDTQQIALSSTADEILFGGSRGGGKSDTSVRWFLYYTDNPKFRGLVIRRNATDLVDFIDRMRTVYQPLGAVITGNPAVVKFPSGSLIYTGHLATADAYTRFQGWEIHYLLIEEVTHIPSVKQYEKLLGSVRSTVPGIKTQVFLTTNPGGPGHEWVKERFAIDNKPSKIKFSRDGRTFIYVNATIRDNPHLMEKDPSYMRYLESLPENLKEQWLNGSWADMDVDGAYYIKQMNVAEKDGRITTVPIESSLKTYTFWDLGISDATSIWIVQANGKEIRVVDYYENNGEGLKHYVNYLHDLRDKYNFTFDGHYLPHDIRVRELSTGQSREVALRKMGINCRLVPNKGVADGIEAARNIIGRCWFDADRCKEGIRSLKNYRKEFDEKKDTYKDQPLHDWSSHAADAFRYFALSWTENISLEDRRILHHGQGKKSLYDY